MEIIIASPGNQCVPSLWFPRSRSFLKPESLSFLKADVLAFIEDLQCLSSHQGRLVSWNLEASEGRSHMLLSRPDLKIGRILK
uniref:Uncharacterized protein n=1 Tax=Manihot esculenta TaxID=3983 RepID=A0A2C9UUL3_MANES